MDAINEIQEAVISRLARDVICEWVGPGDERIACLTPLEYPDGDGVTVWVSAQNGTVQVTDYGLGYQYFLDRPPQDRAALIEIALGIARAHGVELGEGRLFALVDHAGVAEAVWRTATASAELAHAATFLRPRRRTRENDFEEAVFKALQERDVEVARDEEIAGASGHVHHATFFIPRRESILEPVAGPGHYSQVSAVYFKFGDIARANGHKLYALIDDRQTTLRDDWSLALNQVSSILNWSRRPVWIEEVT